MSLIRCHEHDCTFDSDVRTGCPFCEDGGSPWAGRQLELFGSTRAPDHRPTPDKMRAELHAILAELRAAQSWPWKREQFLIWRMIVTYWLPPDEAEAMRAEFDSEAARLDMASD